MPEAKRDEVPLPEPIEAQWRRHRYTEDQLREYGRQCVQAALESTAAELEVMRKDESLARRALLRIFGYVSDDSWRKVADGSVAPPWPTEDQLESMGLKPGRYTRSS